MAYTITKTDGSTLATVADGTINATTTSLVLVGKNYAGYGVFLNQNYVKLLENFAYSTAPSVPLTGQLWYDTSNKVLKVYDASITQWKPISSSASGSTAPGNPVIGDLWWDSTNSQLRVWSGASWVVIGPAYTASAGTSGALPETILDVSSGSHVVIKFYVSNSVIAILSKDATFTPQTAIAGFSTIRPGLNLVSSSTVAGAQFTGDVSSALTLQGLPSTAFLRKDIAETATLPFTASGGLTVGATGAGMDITNTSNTEVAVTSLTNNKDLTFYVNRGGVSTPGIRIVGNTASVQFSNGISVTNALSVGGAATLAANLSVTGSTHLTNQLFANVANFAATASFAANVALNSTVWLIGASRIHADMTPTANNAVSLGSSALRFANVFATTFRGTAITANYADLAERFEADTAYPPGTVVALGGVKEITAEDNELSEDVFGVISTAAGFLMNGGAGDDETHPPIAMTGRVPVRVIGKVNKGDRLVSAGAGLARAASRSEITPFNVIGRALTDKTSEAEGTVEAIVKLNS